MPPRRTHRKSRRGCLVCKQRRVKCDETGPPCGGCRARDIENECHYATSPNPQQNGSLTTGGSTPTNDSHPRSSSSGARSPSPGRKQMEAQLMHRWSTMTYKTISTPCADDGDVWQVHVPDVAFKYDFLLHGLYAIAAFEIASSLPNDFTRYGNAALEYQANAISGFQSQLNVLAPDNHEAILYFSILLTTLTMASAQFVAANGGRASKVENALELYALARGIKVVMKNNKECLKNPLFHKVRPMNELPRTPLDANTENALDRLTMLNENRAALNLGGQGDSQYAEACKNGIFWLRECFLTCLRRDNRSYALPWISFIGTDYIEAIKAKDRLALILLMYWGVLLQPLGHYHWWATDFGIKLVEEVAEEIPADIHPLTREAIVWAQEEVRIAHDEDIYLIP